MYRGLDNSNNIVICRNKGIRGPYTGVDICTATFVVSATEHESAPSVNVERRDVVRGRQTKSSGSPSAGHHDSHAADGTPRARRTVVPSRLAAGDNQ